jgi:hypothetical protein
MHNNRERVLQYFLHPYYPSNPGRDALDDCLRLFRLASFENVNAI